MSAPTRLALNQVSLASDRVKSTVSSRYDLVDHQSRVVRYLRVSLTDRCTYRCTYCMPAEGVDVFPRSSLLSFEEIERVVRVFVAMGVTHIRLTGGEPLARKGVVKLIESLANIDGVLDLAMTTNGHLLKNQAEALR
ncbi:MAG TPA: GTP 3',8-cyclase MoaA, partial [Myxococcales bacterium]|nr:GTP 3',8-cyclase MoaA [Myxococcales bacterium]